MNGGYRPFSLRLLHPNAWMVLIGVKLQIDAQSCPGMGKSNTYHAPFAARSSALSGLSVAER